MFGKNFSLALGLGLIVGCYSAAGSSPTNGGGATKTDGTAATDTGLPCEVAALLSEHCGSCHGATPAKGVSTSLVTRDDLMATDGDGVTFAKVALARMRDTKDPMPPSGTLPDVEIAKLEAWLNGGMAAATCGDVLPDAEDPAIYATALTCTSNTKWTRGDHESELMHPGTACIDCHTEKREGPRLYAAGTVYPTAHEPDDCNGVTNASTKGLKVIITDAKGVDHLLVPNSAGNFMLKTSLPMPYKAKVVSQGGKVRAMKAAQTNGDCNSCHTQDGAEDAPGRIMAP